ncbi:equilibrative nucleotide transporter 3-like isoform X3 [Camellia sinensis]|uniref:equilibrative nucleotide transporter 3-like isoform X3 n=1 Tax=Camellia sinensis TaxID=4442 RepID=UPI00103637CD|nr:equilibrative nucleotide transporter 3-like isoform X3 [Camellia sinensis]
MVFSRVGTWDLPVPYRIHLHLAVSFLIEEAMAIADTIEAPTRLEGKYGAILVCWILGFGSFVPWNSMLTIEDYYSWEFPPRRYHPARVLTVVYQLFALGTMAILAYNESKIDTRKRILIGYIIFFIDALVQGGLVGDLSFMCPEFIQTFLAGLAASGALTSALRLITKAVFEKSSNGLRKGVMLFLAISTFFEFLCIFLYAFIFPKLPIVKYYRAKAASEGSKTVSSDLAAAGIQTEAASQEVEADDKQQQQRLSSKQLFFQNIDFALVLFFIFVLTLSIFPGFLFENTKSHHQLGSWYALVLVAMYNVWDSISRYIPLVERLKLKSRKGLLFATISRVLFIPAFYFTAKYGGLGWMIMLISFLGLTNGYLTVCVLTEAPKGYKGPEQNALGNLLVLCVLGGVVAGASLDWLWLIGSNEQF